MTTPPEDSRVPLTSRVEEGEVVPMPTLPVLVMRNFSTSAIEVEKIGELPPASALMAVWPPASTVNLSVSVEPEVRERRLPVAVSLPIYPDMREPEVRLALVILRKSSVVVLPMARSCPVPSGERVMSPSLVGAVERVRASPLIPKVPEVDSIVGDVAAMIMSPSLLTRGTVLMVAGLVAIYPCRVWVLVVMVSGGSMLVMLLMLVLGGVLAFERVS